MEKRLIIALLCFLVVFEFGFSLYIYKQSVNPNSPSTQQKHESGPLTSGPIAVVLGNWLHKFHEEIIAATTIGILFFTGAVAVYTYGLWLETGKLVKEAKDSSQKDLRAHIGLESMHFPYTGNPLDPSDRRKMLPDTRKQPRIRIRNFGKTAAHHVMVRINSQWTMMNADFEHTYEERDYKAPILMLAPTQAYGVWAHTQGGRAFDPFRYYNTDLELVVVYGAIIYEDIYHRWWVTRFCQFYDGENRFIPYTKYNCEKEYDSRKKALADLSYT